MSTSDVSPEGLKGARPGREATTGVRTGPGGTDQGEQRWRRRHRGEAPMVPKAEFASYYGQPILNKPVWNSPDIPGYLFLGGVAGAGSVIAAAAQLTGRPALSTTLKVGATVAAGLSGVALVHDLGGPARFLNMLRTFKPTSPMSVGSWLLAGYAPLAAGAAASAVTGMALPLGAIATTGAAVIGPAIATYTAALVANTAVPAWHDAHRELPFVFAASAVAAAAGLGLVGAPLCQTGPVRRLGIVAASAEMAGTKLMEQRMGLSSEAYKVGKAARYRRLGAIASAAGVVGAALGGRSRMLSAVSGSALLAGSAFLRFSIFEAGMVSAEDPRYTVVPQRERLEARRAAAT